MAEVHSAPYGVTTTPPNPVGSPVLRHSIRGGDVGVELVDLGARVVSVTMPDRTGRRAPITLGLPSLAHYEDQQRNQFFGETVGRYANRIANAQFVLDGTTYRLEANDGVHHLHGGPEGLGWRVWDAEPFSTAESAGVTFRYESPDGEGGYPGRLQAESRISVSDSGTITFEYTAVTDHATVVGFTNHVYWNLGGTGTIHDHVVSIAANRYLPVDEGIPTQDAPAPVTPALDLRTARRLGEVLDATAGVDHCFLLDPVPEATPQVSVDHPPTGRRVELWTDQPGIQCYTGQHLEGSGHPAFGGLCLEPQQLPDAPNRADFPSPVLRPGETYRARTVIRLLVAR